MRTPQRTHIEVGSRIYAQKGMVLRAIQQFEAALEIHAGSRPAFPRWDNCEEH